MSKGRRIRRRRQEEEEAALRRPAEGDLIRIEPGHFAGLAVIGPDRLPAGSDLDYAELCAELTEHRILPEVGAPSIEPRPEGYCVLALKGMRGEKFSVVTTEIDKAERTVGFWRKGAPYDEDFDITDETVIAHLDGWPVPPVMNPGK